MRCGDEPWHNVHARIGAVAYVHRVLGRVAREARVEIGGRVIFQGEHVQDPTHENLVHIVMAIFAGNDYDVMFHCGIVTYKALARGTSKPPTCVWCIVGVQRFAYATRGS